MVTTPALYWTHWQHLPPTEQWVSPSLSPHKFHLDAHAGFILDIKASLAFCALVNRAVLDPSEMTF